MSMLADASVHVAHDWLDYVAAFAGIGSLVLAAVAAGVAIRSKRDAERSANAAERIARSASATAELTVEMEKRGAEQLGIMRTEHAAFMAEQQRRPEVEPVLEIAGAPNQLAPLNVLIRSGATNVGLRTANQVLILTLVPMGIRVFRADPKGVPLEEIKLFPQREQTLQRRGAQYPAEGFGVKVDVVPAVFQVDHLLLVFPEPDVFEIATRCFHQDIPDGPAWAVAEIDLQGAPLRWTQTKRGGGGRGPG
jgi:hypothetical protein